MTLVRNYRKVGFNTRRERLCHLLPVCRTREASGLVAVGQEPGFNKHGGIDHVSNHKKVCGFRLSHFGMNRLNYGIANALNQTFFRSIQWFLYAAKLHKNLLCPVFLRTAIDLNSPCGRVRGTVAMNAHEDCVLDAVCKGNSISERNISVRVPRKQSLEARLLKFSGESNP